MSVITVNRYIISNADNSSYCNIMLRLDNNIMLRLFVWIDLRSNLIDLMDILWGGVGVCVGWDGTILLPKATQTT